MAKIKPLVWLLADPIAQKRYKTLSAIPLTQLTPYQDGGNLTDDKKSQDNSLELKYLDISIVSLNKMANIFPAMFSSEFYWKKQFVFWFKF